jgi:uncharacterized membrane protein YidH (DUF202 family)
MVVRVIAVVLMIAGLAVLLAGGVRYTRQQEIARVGRMTINGPARTVTAVPRLAGAAMLLGGIVLLGATARRRRRA